MNSTINDIRERHADQSTLNKADLACEVMLRTHCTKVEANSFTNPGLVGSRASFVNALSAGKSHSRQGAESALRALNGILVFRQPGALRPADLENLIEQVEALDMDDVRAQIAAQQSAGV